MQEQKDKLLNTIKVLIDKYHVGELEADAKLYLTMAELDVLFGEEKEHGKHQDE